MVTDLLDALLPLKVIFKSAKLGAKAIISVQVVQEKKHPVCRMLLLSLNEDISETILDRRTLLSERSERY
jgi:hypothetical protein